MAKEAKVIQGSLPRYKKPSFWRVLAQNKTLLLMCLPAIIFFFIFSYMPMPGTYIAFTNFRYNKGIFGSPFIGLQNFKFLFQSGQLTLLLKNTVLYNWLTKYVGVRGNPNCQFHLIRRSLKTNSLWTPIEKGDVLTPVHRPFSFEY